MRAFVRYDKKGIIVPSSFVMKRNKPKVGRWLEISTTKSVSGPPTQSSQGNLRAFVRYNGQNKIVPGSVVVRGQVPTGNWSEITYSLARPIDNKPFIFTVKTDNTGTSASNQFTIPTNGIGYNYFIKTSDGQSIEDITGNYTITFPQEGIYNIEILGDFPRIDFYNGGDRKKLIDIKQWGNIQWDNMDGAFDSTSLTIITANDSPNLSNVTNMFAMFFGCSSLEFINVSNWDVSNVTTMRSLFNNCSSLSEILGLDSWDVSNVTTMRSLFEDCTSLNNINGLSNWDVSSVTNMYAIFFECSSLTDIEPLRNWDVSNVTDMRAMFSKNGGQRNIVSVEPISNWDVSSVDTMEYMFDGALAGPTVDLNNWNTTSLTKASWVFDDLETVNFLGIDQWDISKVVSTNGGGFPAQNSTLTTENYDAILIAWAAQIPLAYNGTLVFGGSKYSLGGAAEAARTALIADVGAIVDGGGIDTRFIFTVKTDNSGTSASNQFRINTIGTGYNYDIEYDGQTLTGQTGNVTLTFPSGAGTYDVKIIGSFPQFYFNNGGDRRKLLDIKNFGIYALGSRSQNGAFRGCSNLIISATDSGRFENVISLYQIWRDCSSLISFPLIDTSSVTEFTGAWQYCSSLTSFPLIDTSSGTDFRRTWQGCSSLTSFPLLDTSSGVSFGGNLLGAWQNCTSLTTFPANAFDTNIASNYANAFSSTNLSTQSIDDILVSLDTNGVSNGIFKQSLGQAPSATGLAARDNLVAKGWTITITT